MRIKKTLAACLAAVAMLSLAGCQLAQEDSAGSQEDDRLIGVFITSERLDLFDTEGYINDNIRGVSPGGEMILNQGDADKYQGRLYAELVCQTLTNEETGTSYEDWEYAFTDLEGYGFFSALVTHPDTGEQYTSAGSDKAISDSEYNISVGDNEGITLKGSVYLPAERSGEALTFAPVYQQPDGAVYLVSGAEYGLPTHDNPTGQAFTHKTSQTLTFTSEGKNKTYTADISVSVRLVYPPEKIVVLQMDEASNVLDRTEYVPGRLPKEISPETDTKFIIAETHKTDNQGLPIVERKLYEKNDELLETFYLRQDNICVAQNTALNWK